MSDLNSWAKEYEEKNNHPPLIIGREYTYLGQFVRLVAASEMIEEVTIVTRFEQCTTCEKVELTWKPDKKQD